jgi:tight adherence protein C
MLPTWLLVGFYIACGLSICCLVARMIWKARAARPTSPQKIVSSTKTAAASAATVAVPSASMSGGTLAASLSLPRELPRIRPEETPLVGEHGLIFGPITPGLAALLPETDSRREELQQELQTAGYYSPHALSNLSALRYALMMGLLILGGVFLILAPRNLEPFALGAIVIGPILGWSLPRLHVRKRAAQRKLQIERSMPDLLDMLNMCVAQGLTVLDALDRVLPHLNDAYPALAQELRIVREQADLGDLNQALRNFDRRIDLPEVHSFTSLLMQTERMGTSVSESLTTYSDSMRESLKQRADEKGNKATFRLLFPTVFCLMPAVYLFLLGPAIIGMSDFLQGGGRAALDQGSQAIERINMNRAANNAADQNF